MKASEALKITKENKLSIDKILECVKNQASYGMTEYIIFGNYLSPETITELVNLGYYVRFVNDEKTYQTIHTISWK